MKRSGRALFIPVMLATVAPVSVGLAAVAGHGPIHANLIAPRHAAAGSSCGSSYLASPAVQQPDTADYYVDQNVVAASTMVRPDVLPIHLGAYAPLGDNDGTPVVVDTKILNGQYQTVAQDPMHGGAWTVVASCGNRLPRSGDKSHQYFFEGAWTVPTDPGAFNLEVTFRFADFSLFSYLINMQVDLSPGPHDPPLPRLNSHIHDTVMLSGLGIQNIVNHAYDLDTLPPTLHVMSTYLFEGDPASRAGQSKIASGMLNGLIDNQDVFANIDQSGSEGAHGGGADNRIVLPCSLCGQAPTGQFSFSQSGVAGSQIGHVTVGAPLAPIPVGDGRHDYTHQVVVDEPLVVCATTDATCDNAAATNLALKVGSYVIDNGFSGPINDGAGSFAENFGDGNGFVFYANPGTPQLDAATPIGNGNARIHVSWQPVNPSATDANTRVLYELQLSDAARLPPGEPPDVIATTTETPFADLTVPSGATYNVRLVAQFVIDNGSGKALTLNSDPRTTRFIVAALASTPTPQPTATQTPVPTNTPTPALPTATSTPAPADISIAQQVLPYAWLRLFHAEDPASPNGLYATTWRNPDPATFAWPVGRPLHLLPAVSERPQDASLTIRDPGTGAMAAISPTNVTATDYSLLDAGSIGSYHCAPASSRLQPYSQNSHYPREPDPFSPRVAVLWGPAVIAGGVPATTVRCDENAALHAGSAEPVTLHYQVHQVLTFDIQFGAAAPGSGSGSVDCTGNLTTGPSATPYSPDPSVPAPQPAFGTTSLVPAGPCPAGGVRVATARAALSAWHQHVALADAGLNTVLQNVSYTVLGANRLRITATVTRAVTLHYHLIFQRALNP